MFVHPVFGADPGNVEDWRLCSVALCGHAAGVEGAGQRLFGREFFRHTLNRQSRPLRPVARLAHRSRHGAGDERSTPAPGAGRRVQHLSLNYPLPGQVHRRLSAIPTIRVRHILCRCLRRAGYYSMVNRSVAYRESSQPRNPQTTFTGGCPSGPSIMHVSPDGLTVSAVGTAVRPEAIARPTTPSTAASGTISPRSRRWDGPAASASASASLVQGGRPAPALPCRGAIFPAPVMKSTRLAAPVNLVSYGQNQLPHRGTTSLHAGQDDRRRHRSRC